MQTLSSDLSDRNCRGRQGLRRLLGGGRRTRLGGPASLSQVFRLFLPSNRLTTADRRRSRSALEQEDLTSWRSLSTPPARVRPAHRSSTTPDRPPRPTTPPPPRRTGS